MPVQAPQPELTERQRTILRTVVEDYIATGQPVGSKNLVRRMGIQRAGVEMPNTFAFGALSRIARICARMTPMDGPAVGIGFYSSMTQDTLIRGTCLSLIF